jgi:hypothetical protein
VPCFVFWVSNVTSKFFVRVLFLFLTKGANILMQWLVYALRYVFFILLQYHCWYRCISLVDCQQTQRAYCFFCICSRQFLLMSNLLTHSCLLLPVFRCFIRRFVLMVGDSVCASFCSFSPLLAG